MRNSVYISGIFFAILLFLINPTIATITILSYLFVANKKENAVWAMVILLLYIWCFQSTRSFSLNEPMDWANGYYINFSQVEKSSAIRYIWGEGREYAWQIINLIGYYLFSGDFLHFAFFIVVLTYLFTFLSIYNYWKDNGNDFRTLLTALILIAFFSEFISIINNLLRQQFAFSIMLLVIVRRMTTGKISWLLLIISLFTHTMVGLFVPFLFVNIKRKFTSKQYVILALCIFILHLLLSRLSIFSSVGIYAFQRLATGNTHNMNDVISVSAVYSFMTVMLIFYIKAFFIDKYCESNRMYFNNLMVILMSICLLLTSLPLFQTRYYILRLFLMPFILPYFFRNRTFATIYQTGVCIIFIVRFLKYNYFWFDIDNVLSRNFFQFDLLGLL